MKRLLVVLLVWFWIGCREQRPAVEVQLRNADGSSSPKLTAELALSPSEQQLGLMYRKELAETSSMLFVFPDERPRSFWMKNTYVELDIIFLDRQFRVVSIAARATPLTETPRESKAPAQFVLEVRGGLAARWNVGEGSLLAVNGDIPGISQQAGR